MTTVFVLNAGSSSIKYTVLEVGTARTVLADGIVERIGVPGSGVPDHAAALDDRARRDRRHGPIDAVGHRIVHGGERFTDATLIDDDVEAAIEGLIELAPLHNPAGLAGIRAARAALPDVPQVAVFDTAFHATIPAEAATYAIDAELAARHGIRRYGFHGTSYQYVSRVAAELLGRDDARIDRAAPRQRGLGGGDPRRALDRHLDGADAARGTRHGHALRRPRPRHPVPPEPRRGSRASMSSTTC